MDRWYKIKPKIKTHEQYLNMETRQEQSQKQVRQLRRTDTGTGIHDEDVVKADFLVRRRRRGDVIRAKQRGRCGWGEISADDRGDQYGRKEQ
jgi:hypothetical protein